LFTVIAVIVALGIGFGVGRIKNAAKLKAISAEFAKVGAEASAEVKAFVEAVKAKIKL